MARYNIIDGSTGSVKCSATPSYNGTVGSVAFLEFREISSPVPIDWHYGDYVVYDRMGYNFVLYTVPQARKTSRRGESGDAFVYSNVQFFAPTKILQLALFKDLVPADNTLHFSSLETVSTFEDVAGIARRIQQCVRDYTGDSSWVIKVLETTDPDILEELGKVKEFSISAGDTCYDALERIRTTWRGVGWIFTIENGINTVTIGRPNLRESSTTTNPFLYGKGKGLTAIKKTISNKTEMFNRLYPFGNTRNMISRYYNNYTPAIKDAQSVHIPNLMLPISSWGLTDSKRDPAKAYIEDSASILAYGLIPKTVYFNNEENGDIYPSIEGVTFADLRAAKREMGETTQGAPDYYPKSSYTNASRVDELKGVSNPPDNGVRSDNEGRSSRQSASINASIDLSSVRRGAGVYQFTSATFGTTAITADGKLRITTDFSATVRAHIADESTGVNILACENVFLRVFVNGAIKKDVTLKHSISNGVLSIGATGTDKTTSVIVDVASGDSVSFAFVFANFSANVSGTQTYELSTTMGTQKSVTLDVVYSFVESFSVTLKQIGFDITEQTSTVDGFGTISMKTGQCAGRNFLVKSATYNASSDDWTLVLYRQEDSSLGQWFPNTIYPLASGDRFVILDIEMPKVYVYTAEQRLLAESQKLLNKHKNPQYAYEPDIDPILMATAEVPITIREGMWMPVSDADLIGGTDETPATEYILIQSLTIDEGEAEIPTYKVTLLDEKKESILQKVLASGRSTNDTVGKIIKDGTRQTVYEGETKAGGGGGGGGDGSVKSVALEMPDDFNVSGSPVTEEGTITVARKTNYLKVYHGTGTDADTLYVQ